MFTGRHRHGTRTCRGKTEVRQPIDVRSCRVVLKGIKHEGDQGAGQRRFVPRNDNVEIHGCTGGHLTGVRDAQTSRRLGTQCQLGVAKPAKQTRRQRAVTRVSRTVRSQNVGPCTIERFCGAERLRVDSDRAIAVRGIAVVVPERVHQTDEKSVVGPRVADACRACEAHRPAVAVAHPRFGEGVAIFPVAGSAVQAENEGQLAAVEEPGDIACSIVRVRPPEAVIRLPALRGIPVIAVDDDADTVDDCRVDRRLGVVAEGLPGARHGIRRNEAAVEKG